MSEETPRKWNNEPPTAGVQRATLGGGCFWCLEAVFQNLRGVLSVVSGYTGGSVGNPTYEQVCSGTTGHAEVVQVEFEGLEISFSDVLEIFFHMHDPTTLNRQGNDVGTQYRSAIFYENEQQKATALDSIERIKASKLWKDAIVTEVVPLGEFYPAERHHQNYYAEHSTQPYCSLVISPKLHKLWERFGERLNVRG